MCAFLAWPDPFSARVKKKGLAMRDYNLSDPLIIYITLYNENEELQSEALLCANGWPTYNAWYLFNLQVVFSIMYLSLSRPTHPR